MTGRAVGGSVAPTGGTMASKKATAKKATTKKAATKKKSKKKAAKKKTTRKVSARKKITVAKERRGLTQGEVALPINDKAVAGLVEKVRAVGGTAIGAYREPLSGKPALIATLPRDKVQPTPFQRDLSPTHTKRLAQKIEESGSFLDPLIVVWGKDERFWTPNGRHRLAAAKVLGLRQITCLISPDDALAYRILALNTEKAHNLKDKSLEVIRMARSLASDKPRSKEVDWASHLEDPELLTLGVIYERQGRFSGSAYQSLLRKVDRFNSTKTLPKSLSEREGWASRLEAIDVDVKKAVDALKKKGFQSPYLKTYVVARVNPVRFVKTKKGDDTPPMAMGALLTKMAANAKKFDADKVNPRELNLVAAAA